jgi:hypothetical protein
MCSLIRRTLFGLLLLVLAGCSGAGAPTAPPSAPPALAERPTQPANSPTQPAPSTVGLDEPTQVVIQATPSTPAPPPALADRSTPELALASYFNAINRQEYERAYGYWEQAPDNADLASFARGFGDTRSVRVLVGLPVFVGVGAGNAYAALPTLLVTLHTDGRLETLQGCYVAHRVNIDPAQRDWSLKQAEIAPGAPDLQGLLQPAGQCAEVNTSGGQSFADTTAPINTLASYYDAIARQDYARAYGYWRAAPDGADTATFAAGFAGTAAVRIYVDPAFNSEGAAGSQFAQSAALVVSQQSDGAVTTLAGCYTLSRPNAGNFDPPAEQPWLLHSAQIAEVAQGNLAGSLAALECGP